MGEEDINNAESLQRNRSGDIDFYVRLALSVQPPVLELGAGAGRVMSAIARAGIQTIGLERSRARLSGAAALVAVLPSAALVQADMRYPPFRARFGLVLIPFRGFLELRDRCDQTSVLAAARASLAPGGRLALDVLNPAVVDVLAGALGADRVPRRQQFSVSPDGPRLRLVYREEMAALLEGAGFTIEALYGDFDATPFHERATEMIWVARRY